MTAPLLLYYQEILQSYFTKGKPFSAVKLNFFKINGSSKN